MAACGLLSGRKNSQDFDGDSEPFSKDGFRKNSISFNTKYYRSQDYSGCHKISHTKISTVDSQPAEHVKNKQTGG